MMGKTDYKQQLKEFYSAKPNTPSVVDVPKMNFILVDGYGDPNTSPEYIAAIEILFPVAYAIRSMCKTELGEEFGVMPLEGLWWTEDAKKFSMLDKSNWLWTAMIMQPKIVTRDIFEQAVQRVRNKKAPKSIDKIRFATYEEGRAAQILYIGPYSQEGPVIEQLHDYITSHGGEIDKNTKHHHEIYLSDPRRTEPAKLKTIIRQPLQAIPYRKFQKFVC